MIPVRQSTAFETAIGPVLDADGVAVTGCVVGDFKIKKTTGNFAALDGSATLTHVSAGTYDLVLTTSDVDTVGLNCVAIDDTVNACQPLYLQVIEEAVYDALFAASAVGPLLANSDGSGLTAINLPNQTMDIVGNITGNLSGSVGTVTGLTASDVGDIKAKTDNLPSDPADASVIAGRFDTLDTSVADVESKVDDLETRLGTPSDLGGGHRIADGRHRRGRRGTDSGRRCNSDGDCDAQQFVQRASSIGCHNGAHRSTHGRLSRHGSNGQRAGLALRNHRPLRRIEHQFNHKDD
jgi:hypothetical protein